MAIELLPDSPNGAITHGTHRQKTNEVVTAVNEIPIINGFQFNVLETNLTPEVWAVPSISLNPNVDANNQFNGSELFSVSGDNIVLNGAKVSAINYIKTNGYIELTPVEGQAAGDFMFEVIAYNPVVYPTVADTFGFGVSEDLLILSRAFISGSKLFRNGVLSGASLWLEKRNTTDDSIVSRENWHIAARAYTEGGNGVTISPFSQLALDVSCNNTV